MPVLWDTKWHTSENGTFGDWKIAPLPDSEEAVALAAEGNKGNTGNTGGLDNSDELGTAIIIALFTNKRLPDYMLDQGFSEADQREWHGNLFSVDEYEEELGSFLYTLKRAPLTDYTAKLAEHYAHQALQTLVRQGRCSGFDITIELRKAEGRLNMSIVPLGVGKRRVYRADLFALR